MASNTENLNLLMKNPSTDGADTFNVDTMLNENWRKIDANAGSVAKTLANILKPTTPPLIGLPPSTTPDDMFQALGNTGELHVWRKTMVTDKAGYNLGSPEGGFLASGSGENNKNNKFTVYYSSSISVSDVGEAVLVSPENITYAYNSENSSGFQQRIRGKFIKIELQLYVGYPQRAHSGLMFIPTDATLSYTTSGTSLGYPYDYCYIVDKMQIVQPHGVGTTTTYPVSTNPNAYQEGSNAGTTIEYLGKLGDKARVQVVSYVGTGTYGVNNKNKLTFSGKPRFIMVPGAPFGYAYIPDGNFYYVMEGDYIMLEDLNCVWDDDTNTMTWYHPSYPYRQYNESKRKYTFVAMY